MREAEREEGRAVRVGVGAVSLALKAAAWAVVVAVPLLGVWAGSSLAVFWDGPIVAALLAGLCAFPILPLAWEGVSAWRRARAPSPGPRILTFSDRLIVRTFVLNSVFLTAFLTLWPVPIFEALASRGDWMLAGRADPVSVEVRRALLGLADSMVWLYELAREDNPYADDDTAPLPEPEPHSLPREQDAPAPPDGGVPDGGPGPGPDGGGAVDAGAADAAPVSADAHEEIPRRVARERGDGPPHWPLPAELHPLVRALPPEHETSITSVARYLRDGEPDPFLRVKALHDYVADRIAYDAPLLALPTHRWPSQEAQHVFRTRKGVCEGYARLLVALGRAAGAEIVYLAGDARDEAGGISGGGHAWNAARIEGRWYLIDATWDAGTVRGGEFSKDYRSVYLFTPPEIFSYSHLPEQRRWQLREQPLSRGEFVRQPQLPPTFFAVGFRLVAPDRSHVTVSERFTAQLENPRGRFVIADIRAPGQPRGERCEVRGGALVEVDCRLPASGTWDVRLFEHAARYGSFEWIGSFVVAGGR